MSQAQGWSRQRKVKLLCDKPVVPEPHVAGFPLATIEFVRTSLRPGLNDRGCKPGQGYRCGCRAELALRAGGVSLATVPATRPTQTPGGPKAGQPDVAV